MVYDATEQGKFARDFKLRDQICGAAGSVMHNCAEGFDSGYDGEFGVFLKYARRSASEVQSEIYLALDRNYVDQPTFKQIYDKATENEEDHQRAHCLSQKKQSSQKQTLTTTRPLDHLTIRLSCLTHPNYNTYSKI